MQVLNSDTTNKKKEEEETSALCFSHKGDTTLSYPLTFNPDR